RAGHLDRAGSGFVDGRLQRGARDLHVRLDRRRTLSGPVRDVRSRLLWSLHRVQLQEGVRTVDVRRRRVDVLTGPLPIGDTAGEIDVEDAVLVAAGPHRRHAAGEVQTREDRAELTVPAGSGWTYGMIVHS